MIKAIFISDSTMRKLDYDKNSAVEERLESFECSSNYISEPYYGVKDAD